MIIITLSAIAFMALLGLVGAYCTVVAARAFLGGGSALYRIITGLETILAVLVLACSIASIFHLVSFLIGFIAWMEA